MVIAFGSYPKGHRFESHHRHHNILWPHGQAVKTSPFHGGIRSSILLGVTTLKKLIPINKRLVFIINTIFILQAR